MAPRPHLRQKTIIAKPIQQESSEAEDSAPGGTPCEPPDISPHKQSMDPSILSLESAAGSVIELSEVSEGLVNPPSEVHLSNLPLNVVPLTKMTSSIQCRAQSDQLLQIKRQQIPILLNFAMTDYSSQGKTREINVVDLGYSRDHQSYYTALSRSSCAAGTVLIQNFSEHKITCGISGWLRQEFRELNVLDEITKLRYTNHLPDNIFAPLRNPVIRAYYLWLANRRDDIAWHPAIQYKVGEEKIKPIEQDATWNIDMLNALRKGDEENTTGIPLKPGVPDIQGPVVKIARTESSNDTSVSLGLIWDSQNYSCAYDSLFTILYNIWTDAPSLWSARFDGITAHLSMLSVGFQHVKNKTIKFEIARDAVRQELYHLDPNQYPLGTTFTCLAELTSIMMATNGCSSGTTFLTCTTCGYKGRTLLHISEYIELNTTGAFQDDENDLRYVSDCLGWNLTDQQRISQFHCPRCSYSIPDQSHPLIFDISMNKFPFLVCIMLNRPCFYINEVLSYPHNEFPVVYQLRGIIYGDGNHFVARLFTKDGRIFFHDGITTGSNLIFEGNLHRIPDAEWLRTSSEGYTCRNAVLAIYARD